MDKFLAVELINVDKWASKLKAVTNPKPFKNGRCPLRADHYKGYDKPLVVKFICVDCDGKQLRSKTKLVYDNQ